jgi:two-component system cell cycle sensor histidine kinase/response regulator CckA
MPEDGLMRRPLRILMVEDNEDDAELLLRELRSHGFEPDLERVQTEGEMAAALENKNFDLIISDYAMPRFSAPDALHLMKSKAVDLPFIIMSGSIGEDRAVSALKAGAHDFIVKGTMSRLVPAIEREIRDAEARRARKVAEESLLQSTKEINDLYNHAPCGYHSLDAEGKFIRINDTELAWLGYERDEILGRRFSEVLVPEFVKSFNENYKLFMQQGFIRDLEFNMLRKDGSVLSVMLNASALRDPDGKFIMSRSIVFDTTERKKFEEQLRQAQKIDAIGQLAGGVAHDFNNLLTVIIGHSMLALERMHPPADIRSALSEIQKTGERAAQLTRQLLAFSRRQMLEPKVIDMNAVLLEMDAMLKRLVPANITLSTNVEPRLSRVFADEGQLSQVVMNLVINARDAIPTNGKIVIETANVTLDDAYCRTHAGVKPGPHVRLAVSDTGTGMSDEVKARIFEPFFTTKETGKGTGLGLSTVYGIVKQSGGSIEVYSELGKGTTFKIYLPKADGEPTPSLSSQVLPAVAAGGEVILLVEDDPAVRELIAEILRLNQYTVLSASNGKQALEVAGAYTGVIHLLLTDMVMPEMSGPELAEKMQTLRPAMHVLCMSGYTERAIVNNGMLAPYMHFLHKPFTPASVSRKIREILDQSSRG